MEFDRDRIRRLEHQVALMRGAEDRALEAERELDEARKDTKRLDWLERENTGLIPYFDGSAISRWESFVNDGGNWYASSARAAIDAALEGEGEAHDQG